MKYTYEIIHHKSERYDSELNRIRGSYNIPIVFDNRQIAESWLDDICYNLKHKNINFVRNRYNILECNLSLDKFSLLYD